MAGAFDAIVLAGGSGRRLGGVDKAAVTIAGEPLLARALRAVGAAGVVAVAGRRRALPVGPREPVWTPEEPPGGGPVAGIVAGLAACRAPAVVVLACDMPLVDGGWVGRLVAELRAAPADVDAVALVDAAGVGQPLAAAYRTAALRRAADALGGPAGAAGVVPAGAAGVSVRALLRRLTVRGLPAGAAAVDTDTWEQVDAAAAALARMDADPGRPGR